VEQEDQSGSGQPWKTSVNSRDVKTVYFSEPVTGKKPVTERPIVSRIIVTGRSALAISRLLVASQRFFLPVFQFPFNIPTQQHGVVVCQITSRCLRTYRRRTKTLLGVPVVPVVPRASPATTTNTAAAALCRRRRRRTTDTATFQDTCHSSLRRHDVSITHVVSDDAYLPISFIPRPPPLLRSF